MGKEPDVGELIAQGENEQVEFKAEPKDLGKEIAAMANAKGGYILIGVSDRGRSVGVDVDKAKELVTNSLVSLTPSPKVEMKVSSLEGKPILVVKVYPSRHIVTVGGRAYIRIGRGTRAMDLSEVMRELVERGALSMDEAPSPVPREEADDSLIEWLMEQRKKRGLGGEPEKVLKALRLVKGDHLTLAGVLFLHPKPQEVYPHMAIRILVGQEWHHLKGPFKELFDRAMALLMAHNPTVVVERHRVRMERHAFSEKALREALVNALVHRNYAIGAEVFVRIGRDRISIENPGSFPPGVSPEDPKPVPRNPWIYETAFQLGYVEKIGSGIELIRREADSSPYFSVSFEVDKEWTKVVFKRLYPEVDEIGEALLSLLERERSTGELLGKVRVSRPTLLKHLKTLERLGLVERIGRGRGVKWRRK